MLRETFTQEDLVQAIQNAPHLKKVTRDEMIAEQILKSLKAQKFKLDTNEHTIVIDLQTVADFDSREVKSLLRSSFPEGTVLDFEAETYHHKTFTLSNRLTSNYRPGPITVPLYVFVALPIDIIIAPFAILTDICKSERVRLRIKIRFTSEEFKRLQVT